jgi:FkbM family methyltransferase
MRKILSRLAARSGNVLLSISRRLYQFPPERAGLSREQQERLDSWFRNQGDKSLRLDYDLNENSTVLDLGGYEGQWTSDIFSKYGCSIHVFEPVADFAERIADRFRPNKKISVHNYGLASENKTVRLALGQDESSAFKDGEEVTEIKLVRALDFFARHNISQIDLMKINIEGGEYELLEHLIKSGFIKNVSNVQVQFHDFVPDAERQMRRIQEELEKTHSLTYQYLFVWENWALKSNPAEV